MKGHLWDPAFTVFSSLSAFFILLSLSISEIICILFFYGMYCDNFHSHCQNLQFHLYCQILSNSSNSSLSRNSFISEFNLDWSLFMLVILFYQFHVFWKLAHNNINVKKYIFLVFENSLKNSNLHLRKKIFAKLSNSNYYFFFFLQNALLKLSLT